MDDRTGSSGRVVIAVAVTDEADAELVADHLFVLGASAVSDTLDGAALVADLPAAAVAGINRAHRVLDVPDDHASGWQEHAVPVRAGERIVVRPAWVDPGDEPAGAVDPVDVVVVVDAGAAFGSGSHPTTRLCLAEVEDLVRPGDRVLDVGSGSGVLGVAALLLGAASVVAVDVDPAAVTATRSTAGLNGVAGALVASATPLAEVPGTFDVVVANLLIPIIEDLGPDLASRTAGRGTLVVSGLLVGQVDRTVAAIGLPVQRVRTDGDWCAVVFRRSTDAVDQASTPTPFQTAM